MSKLYPCKPSISRSEYLQLMGLLLIAKRHNAALKELVAAVVEITGEKDNGGHGADGVYNDYTADELLSKLEIKVRAEKRTASSANSPTEDP